MNASDVNLLFAPGQAAQPLQREAPAYFTDLNLDQFVAALAGEKDEYGLRPLLHTPVAQLETIAHRHAVFRDLDTPAVAQAVDDFLHGLQQVAEQRQRMAKAFHPHEKSRWLLDALHAYGKVVCTLADALRAAAPASDGFRQLGAYLRGYTEGEELRTLREETRELLAQLGEIRYSVRIKGPRVEVSRDQGEADWGQEISATFARFQSGRVERPEVQQPPPRHHTLLEAPWLNTVDERILTQVALLFPQLFARIDAYVRRYQDYADPVVTRTAAQLQFYLCYRQYIAPLRAAGIAFCHPSFSRPGEPVDAAQACDLVLVHQLAASGKAVVCNDVQLGAGEQLLLVSGPNQGGKTTLARMFGQLHYLARLGLPVPARAATLRWWSGLFTHFERSEDIHSLRGKLEDDLVRIHAIIGQVDAGSIVIMNEIFSSTTTDDARWLGERILRRLLALGCIGVCVSFIDDLARLDAAIVSMASTVDPRDPAIRTFKVVRQAPDGKAYAHALAAKHHLTREDLQARL